MCGHRPLSSESERWSRPVFGTVVYQNQFVEVLQCAIVGVVRISYTALPSTRTHRSVRIHCTKISDNTAMITPIKKV